MTSSGASFTLLEVGIPIPGAADDDKTATLDTLIHGLGAYAPLPLARGVFLHFIMSMLMDTTKEAHRANRIHGNYIVSLKIQNKRLLVLRLLEEHLLASIQYGISPTPQHGDEIIPISQSHAMAPFTSGVLAPEIICHVKMLVKNLEFHALSAQACAPREDIFAFINFSHLDVSVPEWAEAAGRLANWVLLNSGASSDALFAQGQDPAEVFAASKAAEACYIHVAAVAAKVAELLASGDSFVYIHPRIFWYILASGVLDMVLFVLGSPEESLEATARIAIYQQWFEQNAEREGWPSMGVFRLGFYHFYSQAAAFRQSWTAANEAEDGASEETVGLF